MLNGGDNQVITKKICGQLFLYFFTCIDTFSFRGVLSVLTPKRVATKIFKISMISDQTSYICMPMQDLWSLQTDILFLKIQTKPNQQKILILVPPPIYNGFFNQPYRKSLKNLCCNSAPKSCHVMARVSETRKFTTIISTYGPTTN